MSQFTVELSGITKTFGSGFKANDSINLKVAKGEIHALVGENGAGKSTLMKILYGMYHPDEGTIRVNGKQVSIHSPADAISHGIGMVHQHFMLVSTLSALENIILGEEITGAFNKIDIKRSIQKTKQILKSFDINIDLTETTGNLSVGTQQKIEIIKLLYRDAEILILDEPTAVLTPQETDDLFRTLNELKLNGKTIILITHKLGEVLEVSDSVTILRRGKVTGVLETKKTNRNELAKLIVGEYIDILPGKSHQPTDEVVLNVSNLRVLSDKRSESVKNISLEIRKGEIFGIAGVEGNGQTELIEAICGLRKPANGKIEINGKVLDDNIPIAHIPADRHKHGIVMEYTVSENVILGRESEAKFSTTLLLKYDNINSYSDMLIKQYDIRPQDSGAIISGLSGGNQQKVVAAREMTKDTGLIVVNHPTRGLDIKAANFVQSALIEESKKGKAILLVSSDLSELLKLSDKIAVMYNGEFNAVLNSNETNEREIGEYMMGLNNN